MGLRVAELLSKSKVNNIDLVSALANAHKKVVRLDIPMNEVTRMNIFDTGDLRNRIKCLSRKQDIKKNIPTDPRGEGLSSG